MKQLKRLSAVLLALVLVLSLSVSAFAAEPTGSITINNNSATGGSVAGKTFNAYKILDATFVDPSDPTQGVAYTVPDALADFYTGRYRTLDKTARDFDEKVVEMIRNDSDPFGFAAAALEAAKTAQIAPVKSVTAGGGAETVTLADLPFGYYIVAENRTLGEKDPVPLSLLMVDTVGTVTLDIKADQPDIDKIIVEADDAGGKGTATDVGQNVQFQLTTKVPKMEGYTKYDFVVHDTFSEGLTYKPETLAITLGGETLSAGSDYTVNFASPNLTITFQNMISRQSDAGKPIVITYSATLNEKALTRKQEENTVYLEYSNNPYETTKGESTKKKTYVYDFDIVIDKYADKGTQDKTTKLEGAKFVLYKKGQGDDKFYYKNENNVVSWVTELEKATEVTTDVQGAASFTGLDTGAYFLQETAAPLGYNKLTKDLDVTIAATYNQDGTINTEVISSPAVPQYTLTAAVANKTGSVLPKTGGIGTTIFYVVGGSLVILATVLLITKKKMNSVNG